MEFRLNRRTNSVPPASTCPWNHASQPCKPPQLKTHTAAKKHRHHKTLPNAAHPNLVNLPAENTPGGQEPTTTKKLTQRRASRPCKPPPQGKHTPRPKNPDITKPYPTPRLLTLNHRHKENTPSHDAPPRRQALAPSRLLSARDVQTPIDTSFCAPLRPSHRRSPCPQRQFPTSKNTAGTSALRCAIPQLSFQTSQLLTKSWDVFFICPPIFF